MACISEHRGDLYETLPLSDFKSSSFVSDSWPGFLIALPEHTVMIIHLKAASDVSFFHNY
jgi:hypothetical protein